MAWVLTKAVDGLDLHDHSFQNVFEDELRSEHLLGEIAGEGQKVGHTVP